MENSIRYEKEIKAWKEKFGRTLHPEFFGDEREIRLYKEKYHNSFCRAENVRHAFIIFILDDRLIKLNSRALDGVHNGEMEEDLEEKRDTDKERISVIGNTFEERSLIDNLRYYIISPLMDIIGRELIDNTYDDQVLYK